jgi:3-oxoacyl-[acyl-carrier protein] reductase
MLLPGMENYAMNSGSLVGKVALIMGGSRGIGAAIVRRLAKEGASTAFTYSASPEKAAAVKVSVEASGGDALAIKADSADVEAVRKAVELTVDTFGKLDILINSAGILVRGTIGAFSVDAFDRMVAVNVRGAFVAAQAAASHMTAGGRIVVIGSTAADRIGFPGGSVYCMTKSALATLAKGMAIDLAPRGITVNTVQPGPTESDMTPADGPRIDALKSLIPVGRLGRDDEIAGLVAYVASPEAAFITGATLTIDGGYAA